MVQDPSITRRRLLSPLIAAPLAGLAAACTPGVLLNRRDHRRGGDRIGRSLAYGEAPRQTMDVYAPPARRRAGLPVAVFFYGGDRGDGRTGAARVQAARAQAARALAARGFLVFLPDYRRLPGTPLPAFVEDAALATARAAQLASTHGGDPVRLAVVGHSAGAHLALMIALDRRYMASVDRPGLIRAAAGLAGPRRSPAFGRGPDLTLTQPIAFVRPDAPPVWLGRTIEAAAAPDEDSVRLDRALTQAGGRSELNLYRDPGQADLLGAVSPLFRRKAPALDDLAAFLHRELG